VKRRLIISGSQVRVLLGPLENKRLTVAHQIAKIKKGNTKVTSEKFFVPRRKNAQPLFSKFLFGRSKFIFLLRRSDFRETSWTESALTQRQKKLHSTRRTNLKANKSKKIPAKKCKCSVFKEPASGLKPRTY
jgi:hypothetical protein